MLTASSVTERPLRAGVSCTQNRRRNQRRLLRHRNLIPETPGVSGSVLQTLTKRAASRAAD